MLNHYITAPLTCPLHTNIQAIEIQVQPVIVKCQLHLEPVSDLVDRTVLIAEIVSDSKNLNYQLDGTV